jgi:beta-N-acetylhexosaminidase
MISDNLGSRAVRRFYDPSGQTFNGPLVARDAFLAGNDLLYLDNFLSSGDPDIYSTHTYERSLFRSEISGEDPAFAQQVDQAVLRILSQISDLWQLILRWRNLTNADFLDEIGISSRVTFNIAQQAATTH